MALTIIEDYILILADRNYLQKHLFQLLHFFVVQSNLNSSNTDGSFIMANSNSFLSPCEILPISQEIKYLGKSSFFITKLYVVCIH